MAQIRSRPSDLPTRWPHTPPRCPRRPCARWGPWRDTRQEARHAATAPPSPAGGGLPHAPRPLGCGPQGEEHHATARLPGSVPPCSRTVGQAVWGVPQTDGGICPGGPHPASARPSAAPAGPSGHGPGVGGHVSCLRWVVWRLGSAHGFSGVFLPRAQPLTASGKRRATAPLTAALAPKRALWPVRFSAMLDAAGPRPPGRPRFPQARPASGACGAPAGGRMPSRVAFPRPHSGGPVAASAEGCIPDWSPPRPTPAAPRPWERRPYGPSRGGRGSSPPGWRLTPAVSRAQWPERGTSAGCWASAPVRG
jgi:hypothetical protein